MKPLKICLCFVCLWVTPRLVSAAMVGPYAPDGNTLFLMHFDETGTSVTTNTGSVGGNFITCTNTTSFNGLAGNLPEVTDLLGQPSYTATGVNFTNAVAGTDNGGGGIGTIGFDGNGDGAYTASSSGATPDAIALRNLGIGVSNDSPFTIEAVIRPTTITAPKINGQSGNQEIVCSDSMGQRGFQFRITSSGQLEFDMINGDHIDVTYSIPTTGPNAFVSDHWYHTAVTYDGTYLRFYWTAMNPTNSGDAPLGSPVRWNCTTNTGNLVVPVVIGGENRGGDQEAFQGLIDEVRISNVARSISLMQFYSQGVSIVRPPLNLNVDSFMPATFSVEASSTLPLGYQWYFKGSPILSATNSTYTITTVFDTNAGPYYVVVTNSAGYSATSATANLTVGAFNFLAHRWSFTNDMMDSIGGVDGTSNGTATVSGGALVLDGSSNCFMSLPGNLLRGLSAVTFDFWAKFGTNASDCRVFDFGNTNFNNPYVAPEQNYVYFSPHTGSGTHQIGISGSSVQSEQDVSAGGTLDGRDVHVTCVVNPPDGYMSIYTNGQLEATFAGLTTPLGSLADSLDAIGTVLDNHGLCLNASIDEFRIFNGALSAASVQQDDAAGPNAVPYEGPVKFALQPVDTISTAGQPVTFKSVTLGNEPISYQWFENGSPIAGATGPTYSFTAAAGQNGAAFSVTATNEVEGTNYYAVSTNATLTLVTPQNLTWTGVNGPNWDTTTLNWNNGSSSVAYGQYDKPVFDNTGLAQAQVNVAQPLYMVGLTANNSSGNYVISSSSNGGGSLNGHAPVVVSGGGQLTLDLPNNLSGGTYIQNGVLQIGNNDGSGTIGAGAITNDGTLTFARTNTISVTNSIQGSGGIVLNASGDVFLTASNTYTGVTMVNAGTLHVQNGSSLGTSSKATVAASGKIYIDKNVNVAVPLTLNGGTLEKGGGGLTTYFSPVSLGSASSLSVDGGATLNLTNSAGISGGFGLTLGGSGNGIISGPMSLGANPLTVNGGSWTVAPNNNYSGGTSLNGGALRITGAGSLGSGAITLAGGTLEAVNNFSLASGSSQTITVNVNSTIAVDSGAKFTVGNAISGSGSVTLTKAGPGKLILSGANNFLGFLDVDTGSASADDGTTVIANNAAISQMLAVPGIPSIFIRNNNSGSSTLALDGTASSINVAQDISLAGRGGAVPAIDNLAGTNTISGNFELASGGNYVLQSDAGVLNLTQPWPFLPPAGITGTRTLIIGGAGTLTMSGGVQDGTLGSTNVPTRLIKVGTGVLNLPAANSYSGETIVSNGVLTLSGSITSTGMVQVAGGALAGTGTINDNVTVDSSSASGTIDALAVNGNLTIKGPLVVDVNRAGLQSDSFTVSGAVTNSGTGAIVVNNLGASLQVGDQFFLFSKGVLNAANMTVTGGGVQWKNNLATDGSITVASTMATTPTNIVVTVSGNQLKLSWPPNYQGWILQAQTNSLSAGLSTNWYDVTGSGSVTNISIPISATSPTVFYRLRLP